MSTDKNADKSTADAAPEVVSDAALDDVAGGGLLLPAVQKVRVASLKACDGSVKPVGDQFMGFGEGSGV